MVGVAQERAGDALDERLLDLAGIAHALMIRMAAEASGGLGDTVRAEWVAGEAAQRAGVHKIGFVTDPE